MESALEPQQEFRCDELEGRSEANRNQPEIPRAGERT